MIALVSLSRVCFSALDCAIVAACTHEGQMLFEYSLRLPDCGVTIGVVDGRDAIGGVKDVGSGIFGIETFEALLQ
jgi:hypothetical protein